jgi:hypothetical protein
MNGTITDTLPQGQLPAAEEAWRRLVSLYANQTRYVLRDLGLPVSPALDRLRMMRQTHDPAEPAPPEFFDRLAAYLQAGRLPAPVHTRVKYRVDYAYSTLRKLGLPVPPELVRLRQALSRGDVR